MREILTIPGGLEGIAWFYVNRGPLRRRMHRHDELELNLVTSGRATYLIADQRYDLTPGVQLWLFPAQDHLLIDESPDYRMWIAVVRRRLLEPFCKDTPASVLLRRRPGGFFGRLLGPADFDKAARLFQDVADAAADPPRCNAGLAHLFLSAWAFHQNAPSLEIGAEVHPAVESAARLLRDAPRMPDLPLLARQCGLSPSRLSRLFKQQTGLTISAYRNRQRVQRFLAIYGTGRRYSLTQSAFRAGFGSYPQFHRVFRAVVGCTPAAHRRRQHQAPEPANSGPV
jgi:AraC-like DNA-binding protein